MENLQADCKAFESSTTCENKEIRLEKLKIKTMKVSAFKKGEINFPNRDSRRKHKRE